MYDTCSISEQLKFQLEGALPPQRRLSFHIESEFTRLSGAPESWPSTTTYLATCSAVGSLQDFLS